MALAVGAVVIVATPAGRAESRCPIEVHRRVAIPDFKMKAD
jgi:hypothetical protein